MSRRSDTVWDVIDRWGEEFPPPVQPGSAADDDHKAAPGWEPSFASWEAWMGAVDHLEVLRHVVGKESMIHAFAPWSLLRVAMENAALAAWLLRPESSDDRIARRLRLAYWDWGDVLEIEKSRGGVVQNSGATARRNEVIELATARGIDKNVICGRWSWASVVRESSTVGQLSLSRHIEVLWRICSGFAHAREWARLGWLELEVSDDTDAGLTDIAMHSDLKRLYGVIFVAFDVTRAARSLIDTRRLTWRES